MKVKELLERIQIMKNEELDYKYKELTKQIYENISRKTRGKR